MPAGYDPDEVGSLSSADLHRLWQRHLAATTVAPSPDEDDTDDGAFTMVDDDGPSWSGPDPDDDDGYDDEGF